MINPIELRFTNTKKEYIKALQTYYKKHGSIRSLILAGVILILGLYFTSSEENIDVGLVLIILSSALIVMVAIVNLILPHFWYKQQIKYEDEYFLSFSDESIAFETPHISSKLDWTCYSYAWETKELYLLFQSKRLFSIVPKRAFISNEQENQFKELLNQKLEKGVKKI